MGLVKSNNKLTSVMKRIFSDNGNNRTTFLRKRVKIFSIIGLYWTVSISMVFTNKYLLGGVDFKEDISLFVAWYQSCVVVVTCAIVNVITARIGCRRRSRLISRRLFQRDMVMLSLTFVTGLLANNMMLRHITVAFYQVARSPTLIFVVILSRITLGKIINVNVVACCGLVIVGYYLAASQDNRLESLPVKGILYGISASFVTALGGIVVKKSENLMTRDALKMTFSFNFLSGAAFYILLISSGQFPALWKTLQHTDPWFWLILTCSGVFSLLLGVSSTLEIHETSPISHHISISAKSVTQTVMAVIYFRERKTALWWMGNILTILGTVSYAVTRLKNEKVKENRTIEV